MHRITSQAHAQKQLDRRTCNNTANISSSSLERIYYSSVFVALILSSKKCILYVKPETCPTREVDGQHSIHCYWHTRRQTEKSDNYYCYICLMAFSRTTWVSWHQKGKQFRILLAQEMTGWQWHQVDHMQIICTLLQTDNHGSTSPLSLL